MKSKNNKLTKNRVAVPSSSVHNLRDFLQSTSMHGLKYAADKDACWIERFFWVTMFVAGFFAASFFIVRIWIKWQNSPVLISIESTDFPNYHLPFPTVSICSVNHASDKNIGKMFKTYPDWKNLERQDTLDLMASMMNQAGTLTPSEMERIKWIENEVQLNNLTSANGSQFMIDISPSCSKMVISCKWGRTMTNCSNVILQVPSSQGVCCVFNLQTVHLNMQKSSLNKDASNVQFNEPEKEKEPLRSYGEGANTGFTVLLNAEVEDYAFASSSFIGFKVLIHNPEDQPDPSSKGIAISPGTEVFAAIRTASILSTEEVRRLPIQSRGCRYSDENNLKFYSRYSQSNCWMEHMAKRIIDLCQCLPYYLLVGDISTRTCSSEKNQCIQEAIDAFNREIDLSDDCPANCNGVVYWTDVTQGTFPNKDFMNRIQRNLRSNYFTASQMKFHNETYVRENGVLLHVFYRDRSGIRYKRDIRYDWQDFVSAVGGLLGLGIGFSLLSLMEILYFFGGLRSCFRWRRERRRPASVRPFIQMNKQRLPKHRMRLYY